MSDTYSGGFADIWNNRAALPMINENISGADTFQTLASGNAQDYSTNFDLGNTAQYTNPQTQQYSASAQSALDNIISNQNAPDFLTGTQKSVASTAVDYVAKYVGRISIIVLGLVFVVAGLHMFGKSQ